MYNVKLTRRNDFVGSAKRCADKKITFLKSIILLTSNKNKGKCICIF